MKKRSSSPRWRHRAVLHGRGRHATGSHPSGLSARLMWTWTAAARSLAGSRLPRSPRGFRRTARAWRSTRRRTATSGSRTFRIFKPRAGSRPRAATADHSGPATGHGSCMSPITKGPRPSSGGQPTAPASPSFWSKPARAPESWSASAAAVLVHHLQESRRLRRLDLLAQRQTCDAVRRRAGLAAAQQPLLAGWALARLRLWRERCAAGLRAALSRAGREECR